MAKNKLNSKRKICFPIMSRIHYARQKQLLSVIKKHPKLDLQLVVGGSVLLERYGERFVPAIKKDGFKIHETLFNVIDGGNHITMAKTAGLTTLEFATTLYKLNPDIVLIRGDRFEQLAIATAAAYLNKTIAHIEGGDVTGTIDESVRHAITKLAHIHFVTNEDSKKRVLQMGENPKFVFNVGSPDVEFASLVSKKFDGNFVNKAGIGAEIDVSKKFLIAMYHPVTTEGNNRENTEMILKAIDNLNIPAVWFWPNSDAGTNEIAKAIRVYRERGILKNSKLRFVTDLLPEDFIGLLRRSSLLIGNSSAGIKECSYLGVPVVNIGTRQSNRLRGPNVLDVGYNHQEISKAIKQQLNKGVYKSSQIYYNKNSSKIMSDVLSSVDLYIQKKFFDIKNV